MIVNGSFAADANQDGLADGWAVEEAGGLKIRPALVAGPGGGPAQQLTVTPQPSEATRQHAMLLQQDTVTLRQGQWYRLTMQARGEIAGSTVSIAIRQTEPWADLGLSDQFRVQAGWRRYEFTFRARKDTDRNVRLQLWFTQPGEFAVADLALAEAEDQAARRRYVEAVPAVEAKNLIPNGSFESGTGGWGSIGPGVGWGQSSLCRLFGRLEGDAAEGEQSFRIDLDKATAPHLAFDYFNVEEQPVHLALVGNRGWIEVTPGQPYTLSASVKAAPAGTPCVLAVYQAFTRGEEMRHEFTAKAEWERVSFTFTPEAKQLFVALGPDLRRSDQSRATVWVDAVQLEAGRRATKYAPRTPLEVGLTWAKPGHLFASAKEARATVTASNAGGRLRRVQVRATVTDLFDRVVARPAVTLRVPAHGSASEELPLGVTDKGYYQVRLQSAEATVLPLLAERFAVVDLPREADGPFGMNHAYADEEMIKVSRDIGLSWFRDWSLKWHQVEPEQGRFDFAPFDFQIDRVLREKLKVIGLLPFPAARWSTTAPAEMLSPGELGEQSWAAYLPRDLEEFAHYVRTTVRHYAGRLHVWEILNEPLYTGYAVPARFGYTVPDYVKLLKVAYQAVKEVQPEAVVIGGIAGEPETFMEEFIAAGGLEWVDLLNLHIYPVFQSPEPYLPRLEGLHARMRQAGRPVPLAYTEGSYYGDDDLPFLPYHPGDMLMKPLESELECACYQTRFNLILLSQGVKFFIYHAGTGGALNNPAVGGIFFEWDSAPRKMAITQSVMSALFATDTAPIGSVWEQVRSFAFHSRGETVVAVWDELERGFTLCPQSGARVLNLAGTTVKEAGLTVHYRVPVLREGQRVWVEVEELDSNNGIATYDTPDEFGAIMQAYVATGRVRQGTVGAAQSYLLDAADLVPFAAGWMEGHLRGAPSSR